MTDNSLRQRWTGSVRYLDRLRDNADKWLFVVIFVIGAASILVMKGIGASKILAITVPVLWLVIYLALAWFSRKFRLREDRIAENCYYLGLLFTLVSLAYALYAFTTDVAATSAIITNFGVALSSTIAGLTLRVLISQLREDPIEYEREARLELADATTRLTAELRSSVEDFASFRRSMIQVLDEGMSEIAATANASIEANAQKLSEFGTAALAKVESSYTSFSQNSVKLNESSQRSVEALETLITRVKAIDVSADMISRKLDPIVEGFRSLLHEAAERTAAQKAEFTRVTKAATLANDANTRLEQSLRAIEATLRSSTETLNREFAAGSTAAAEMRQSLSGLAAAVTADIELLRETSGSVRQVLTGDLHSVRELRTELENEVGAAEIMVGKMHTALVSLADRITESVSVPS